MSQIPDHPLRILTIGGSGSEKTNGLLNLTNKQPNIDKIYPYAEDPYEPKHQLLVGKREQAGIKFIKDPKAFIKYLIYIKDV